MTGDAQQPDFHELGNALPGDGAGVVQSDAAPQNGAEREAHEEWLESFWRDCPDCDHDNHRCGGCGAPTDHDGRHKCTEIA